MKNALWTVVDILEFAFIMALISITAVVVALGEATKAAIDNRKAARAGSVEK